MTDPMEYLSIWRWPRWARRLWLITFPVSGPLLLLAWFALAIFGLVLGFIWISGAWLRDNARSLWSRP